MNFVQEIFKLNTLNCSYLRLLDVSVSVLNVSFVINFSHISLSMLQENVLLELLALSSKSLHNFIFVSFLFLRFFAIQFCCFADKVKGIKN